MIRKLRSGEYRLYSRKKIPGPTSGGILERSRHARLLRNTKEKSSTLKGIEFFERYTYTITERHPIHTTF